MHAVLANESPPKALQRVGIVLEPIALANAQELVGTLNASSADCPSEAPVEVAIQGVESVVLRLDTDCDWEIAAQIPGRWVPTQRLAAEDLPGLESLRVSVYPASAMAGQLRMPDASPPPDSVKIQLQSQNDSPMGTLCPVRGGKLTCKVPAGTFDLKLTVDGYVPRYLWNAKLKPDATFELAPWELEVGASVAGWIELDDGVAGNLSLADVDPTVTLERQVSGWLGDPSKRQRMDLRRLETMADQKGFFQLAGAEAGGFRLVVTADGFIPLEVRDLTLETGQERVLDDSLVLVRPVPIEVTVSPPLQPGGAPWRIELATFDVGSRVLDAQISEDVPESGSWTHLAERLGNHKITVKDAQGKPWAEQWVDVGPGVRPVFIEIPLLEVVGRISMGDEPLETRLVFGSTQGARQVEMQSDAQGRFEGFLPREGTWPVDLVIHDGGFLNQALPPVEVERKAGQRVARVDIELPGVRLTGEVLLDGEPVPEARLVFLREENGERRRAGIAAADEDGRFTLWGVEPGTLWMHAYFTDLASPWERVDIVEGLDAPHVRLEMESKLKVVGLVLSPDGEVPGARITAMPKMRDGSSGMSARAQTDVDGSFSLSLPQDTVTADLIVQAPGYALQMLSLSLHQDRPNQAMIHVERESGRVMLRSQVFKEGAEKVQLESDSTLHYNGVAVPVQFLLTRNLDKLTYGGEGFGLRSMPTGPYRLCNASSSACEDGFLAPGGELWMNDPPVPP